MPFLGAPSQMTDKCFLCLNESRTRQCRHCTLKAHKRCWKTLMAHGETRCPMCRTPLSHPARATRRSQHPNHVVQTIKDYLTTIEETSDRQRKRGVCNDLFQYLVDNRWFLEERPRLLAVAKTKLSELIYNEGWTEGARYSEHL